ncbi:MAG TPA: PIG-L deacetylase family protein [Dongiaceae bacterium]|nr:PIG-L deacetylase family protein [Dongiaceae bacterium]
MLQPLLFGGAGQHRHILCLGSHCDDIEIGCGGTLLTLLDRNPGLEVTWVIFASNEERRKEATAGAERFTQKAGKLNLRIFDIRDGFLPYVGAQVKDLFEQIKREVKPDLILTHYRHDLHQDHRLVNELTWNTFRNHLILEYEIPKWDGDLGTPNVYFAIDEEVGQRKIQYLQEVYASQQGKNWFTPDLFWSLMRIRGMECNSPSRFAEAFYARKLMLSPGS